MIANKKLNIIRQAIMLDHDHNLATRTLSLNELQQLLLGSFGEYRTGSFSTLMMRLRNTSETPRTQQQPRSLLQAMQQFLQAQHAATPASGVTAGEPTRPQLESVIRAIACYEEQPAAQSQRPALNAAQAYREARQALHASQSAETLALSILTNHRNRNRPTSNTTEPQRRSACEAAKQLRSLLADNHVFTANPKQRANLFLHFNTLIKSKLQSSLPRSTGELDLVVNTHDSYGESTRLNYLQIMTASLRGSPDVQIVSEINSLLETELTSTITFAQVLVPHASDHMNGAAILKAFNKLTPNEQRLFLLKWSRATLKICQLVNRELAQLLASQPPAPASTPLPRRLAVETGIQPQAPLRPTQSMEYLPPPQNVEAETETTPAADISAPSRRASGASASAAALENTSSAEMSLANSERSDPATDAAPKKAGKLRRLYTAIFKKNEIEKTREQKIIEKCRQKLNKAFQPKGALAELKQKTFAIYATGCDAEAKASFTKMLSDSEKLLGKLNTHISIILLERNSEFIGQIRTAFAIVLNAKFLHGKILPRQHPLALRPLFMGSFYYQSICSYLQNCPLPWDLHTLEQKITLLFNHLKSGATDRSYRPQELSIENFTLIDVPLAPDIELPKSYCLKALELDHNATDQESRSAYTSLCLQCHPDKDQDNPEQAMAKFLRLQVLFFQLKLDELTP